MSVETKFNLGDIVRRKDMGYGSYAWMIGPIDEMRIHVALPPFAKGGDDTLASVSPDKE